MSVTLRKRKNSDGTTTLYLDIYNNGKRSYEFLKHLKLGKPANVSDRQANKDKLDQAKRIELKRAQELSANDYSMVTDNAKKIEIIAWMQNFVDGLYQEGQKKHAGSAEPV